MQTKDELEEWFSKPDPWGYTTDPDDDLRRKYIAGIVLPHYRKGRLLDLGAAEGFVSNQYSENFQLDQIEISDNAAKSLKHRVLLPIGEYEVILALGVLYEHYDYEKLRDYIEQHASGIVVTSHYDKISVAHDKFDKPQIFYAEFPYRDGKQILRVYKW